MRSSENPSFDVIQKMVLIGDSGVGKSSLLARYALGTCPSAHYTTIGVEFRTRVLVIEEKRVKTQIWDTAGQDRYKTITNAYYRGALAVILVFDLTKNDSFENLNKWLREVEQYAPTDTKIILIGNKSDLVDERAVSQNAINDFMNINGISHYFPISVKENTQATVETVFRAAAEKIFQSRAIPNVKAPILPPAPQDKEKTRESNEEAKLLPEHNKSIKLSNAFINYNPTLKEVLVLRLEKYIERIKGYQDGDGHNSFDNGFWFFKKSRARSRAVNFRFANKLLANLQASDGSADSISNIFRDIDATRANAIHDLSLMLDSSALSKSQQKTCKERGTNSTELNEVIEIARHSLGR